MKYSYILLTLSIILLIQPFDAEAVNTLEAKGDSAYNTGNYDEAIMYYDSVATTSGVSAALLFNLGNAYYKNGDDGMAMVAYKRARKLSPRNDRIKENTRFLESKIEDVNKAELKGKKGNVSPDPESFFGKAGNVLTVDTPSNTWAFFAATAFIIFIAGIALYLFSPMVRVKKIGFFSGLIMMMFCIIFIILALTSAHKFENRDEGVLMGFKNMLKEEPSSGATDIGTPLHRGTVVKILEVDEGIEDEPTWYKVKLNSDNIGWIEKSSLEII